MNNTFIIATNEERGYTLLMRLDKNDNPVKNEPYVVAWGYDPVDQDWLQGHYFDDIRKAIAYLFS